MLTGMDDNILRREPNRLKSRADGAFMPVWIKTLLGAPQ